jgi:aryl-alcohol dehydrogenase-like predicted oxidoreductase
MPYSLMERGIEREHVSAAREFEMGITPWSPLAAGFLAGKYRRDGEGKVSAGGGRLDLNLPSFQLFTERNWQVLERVRSVAAEAELDMAQMALAWAAAQPGVTSLILGASKLDQLHSNLAALDITLSPDILKKLADASGSDLTMMDRFFSPGLKKGVFGGAQVTGWN